MRRNFSLLLNYNRKASLLVHCNRGASGSSLSAHFKAEECIIWRTLLRPVKRKTSKSV